MTHCPSSGTVIEHDVSFCHQYGDDGSAVSTHSTVESSPTPRAKDAGTQTVTISTRKEKRHYNIDTITFLKRTSSLSSTGRLAVIVIAAIGFLAGIRLVQCVENGTIYQVILVLSLAIVLTSKSYVDVGTQTGSDRYRESESEGFAHEITEAADDGISIAGNYREGFTHTPMRGPTASHIEST